MLSRKGDYDNDYGHWGTDDNRVPVASTYRVAWREFAATTGFRTLYPALIPPGTRHVHAVNSCRHPNDPSELSQAGAVMSSFLSDYFVRSAGTGHIFNDLVRGLPFALTGQWAVQASRLFLRLNCLTFVYAPLWKEVTGEEWTVSTPLRKAEERQSAQNDIDAIVALSLGVSADELCMIYRTQFPVMRKYDQADLFDADGHLVPKHIARAESLAKQPEQLSIEERTWTHPQSGAEYVFSYPFKAMDREAALRRSYDHHSRMVSP